MTIENNLYNSFYDGFEKRTAKIKKFRAEDNIKAIEKIESKFKRDNRLTKYVERSFWVGAVVGIIAMSKEITGADPYDMGLKLSVGLSIMTPALGTHFHYTRKLEILLEDKILGKLTGIPNRQNVRKLQKIGRYSHLSAVATLLTLVGSAGYDLYNAHPFIVGFAGCIGGFAYYHNYIEGYHALYSSMGDFILGERRQQNKTKKNI